MDDDEVVARAGDFLDAAFAALTRDHVLPTPRFHPYLQVGRDYFGDEVAGHALQVFEQALQDAFPERFADPMTRENAEFPMTYAHSLLEACIARCTIGHQAYSSRSPAAVEMITELLRLLRSVEDDMACCRAVSHLTTESRQQLQLGQVLVVPVETTSDGLSSYAENVIPGAYGAFNRQDPRIYDPPQAMLVARETSAAGDPYSAMGRVSAELDRFLLLVRLMHGSTVESLWQMSGPNTLLSRVNPQYRRYRPGNMIMSMIRRTAHLVPEDELPLERLGELLSGAQVKRDKMAFISFDLALDRFSRTYRVEDPWSNIVDLATAMEGALADPGDGAEGLSLRLKARSAALLATSGDGGKEIFRDVGLLYGLRSKLVHGGNMKSAELRKSVMGLSTMPTDAPFGVAVRYAVDRMRDLTRRAILARLSLAASSEPPWPFNQSVDVDRQLADDAERDRWRTVWRGQLTDAGCPSAADEARMPVDGLSQEDR